MFPTIVWIRTSCSGSPGDWQSISDAGFGKERLRSTSMKRSSFLIPGNTLPRTGVPGCPSSPSTGIMAMT